MMDPEYQAKKRELDAALREEGRRLRQEANANVYGDEESQAEDHPPLDEQLKAAAEAAEAALVAAKEATLTGAVVGDLVVSAMSDGSVGIRDADGNGGWLLDPFRAIDAGQRLIQMATEQLLAQARKGQIEPVTHARPRIFTGIPRSGE